MSKLSGNDIAKQVGLGDIIIEPYDYKFIRPNSYDLRLGNEMRILIPNSRMSGTNLIDPHEHGQSVDVDMNMKFGGWILYPNELYLSSTFEVAGSKVFIPGIEGRSSAARLGISPHVSAGFGDVGFVGNWTLEITVTEVTILRPMDIVCQVFFEPVIGELGPYYDGEYNGQTGPKDSKGIK